MHFFFKTPSLSTLFSFFFFNDPPPPEISPLPLPAALPILAEPINSPQPLSQPHPPIMVGGGGERKTLRLVARYADACNLFTRYPKRDLTRKLDRKSTRLNSSHSQISYAVFCLKKKKMTIITEILKRLQNNHLRPICLSDATTNSVLYNSQEYINWFIVVMSACRNNSRFRFELS